jgi:hypothetical protein
MDKLSPFTDKPTVTRRAELEAIELTEVVEHAPDARVYCETLGLWTVGGRVELCGHFREMEDCRYCYDGGMEHEPCPGCSS